MTDKEVAGYWNANADTWTQLVRAGADVYRDHLNTPAFFDLLPPIEGLVGLDLGCGEGHNTRLLAARGARMTAIDIAETFIRHAREAEVATPAGIDYHVGSAVVLPFADASFDFATAFMSLMDMSDLPRVLAGVRRVLRPGGFLQFSIEHPCFNPPHRQKVPGLDGRAIAMEVGDYFRALDGEISEWMFKAVLADLRASLPRFRIPRFTRTLSAWLNLLLDAGFTIERLAEPRPSDEAVRLQPRLQDAQVVAYFLHVRARTGV